MKVMNVLQRKIAFFFSHPANAKEEKVYVRVGTTTLVRSNNLERFKKQYELKDTDFEVHYREEKKKPKTKKEE